MNNFLFMGEINSFLPSSSTHQSEWSYKGDYEPFSYSELPGNQINYIFTYLLETSCERDYETISCSVLPADEINLSLPSSSTRQIKKFSEGDYE